MRPAERSPGFGDALKRLRTAAGLTQEDLAERAGISAHGVSALERGVNATPRRETLARLIAALGLAASDRALLEAAARGALAQSDSSAASPAAAPLIGRASELAAVDALLADAAPPVLLLTGEPGIGKTRVLREAAERARRRGYAVLEGGCARTGRDAFAPVSEALARSVEARTPARAAADLEGCAGLARLLPELVESGVLPAPRWTGSPDQERRVMFRAVERYLANRAGAAGTLLALDDLHWAGADGLDLLVALARTAAERRLRIVATYRGGEMAGHDALASALGDLAHARLAKCLEMGPMTSEEAQDLLEGLLPAGAAADVTLVERVARRAGGVPYFLVSYAETLRTAGSDPARLEIVPWDVAQSVRQRVGRLPPATHGVLATLAVAGMPLPLGALSAIGAALGLSRAQLLEVLDAACSALIVRHTGESIYQFAHDLIRDAVEADLSEPRRVALHQLVAEALDGSAFAPPSDVLAYHYSQAGDGPRAIIHLERAAGKAAASHAHAAAAGYYRDLVRWLDDVGQPAEAAWARVRLGAVLATLARYDEALEQLDAALATFRAVDDAERTLIALTRIGEVYALHGRPDEGLAVLRPALDPADGALTAGTLAASHVAYAWLLNMSGGYADALAVAEKAAGLARSAADVLLQVQADLRRSQLLLMLGRLEEGARILEEVIPLAESIGDLRSLRLALNSLGWVHEAWGEFERDADYTDRAYRVALELGDPTVIAFMTANHGGPAFNVGNWSAARADFEASWALMSQLGETWASAWPSLLLGQLDLAEGHWEAGEASLSQALLLAETTHDVQALRWAQATLAERDLLHGQPRAAHERLLPLLDHPEQREADVCPLLPLLAWAAVDLGDEAEAASLLADALARAGAAQMRPTLISAWRVRARLALWQGRGTLAARDLERALACARELRYPYGEAKVLYDYGWVCARLGRRRSARRHLEAALVTLGRLGECLYATRAEALLADLTLQVVEAGH